MRRGEGRGEEEEETGHHQTREEHAAGGPQLEAVADSEHVSSAPDNGSVDTDVIFPFNRDGHWDGYEVSGQLCRPNPEHGGSHDRDLLTNLGIEWFKRDAGVCCQKYSQLIEYL